jgi:phenylacetate-CoA ligase
MPELAQTVSAEIKNKIMVSANVEAVPYGSLPRSERKSKRFFDNRSD